MKITEVTVRDIRFPTSLELHGSDAVVEEESQFNRVDSRCNVFVSTLEETERLIGKHEISTGTRFTCYQKTKEFGIQTTILDGHRILWEEIAKNKHSNRKIQYDGVPFMVVGKKFLNCQTGIDDHCKRVKKTEDKKDKDGNFILKRRKVKEKNTSKQFDCKATIELKEILKFPAFKATKNSEWCRRQQAQKFHQAIQNGENLIYERKFLVSFPSFSSHTNHSLRDHKAPDYSAVYIVLKTDSPDGLQGYGLTFTLGRGNELVASATRLYGQMLIGKCVEDIFADFGSLWRELAHEEQLRWLGPEKGVIHLALAGVINALWDLWGRIEGKPVWKLLADMSPEQLVSTIDFSYLSDVLTKEQALEILRKNAPTKQEREKQILENGYPAYTTSAGWIGYTDQQIEDLCNKFMQNGWTRFKMKVGSDIADDIRRARILRKTLGPDKFLAMDSNQRWDVNEAIEAMKQLAEFKPIWIEEPTSPDDVIGHAFISQALAPYGIGVATGEHCQNRVMFKQFLQSGGMQFCQIDSCRIGGLNEILPVLLMAAKFGVPVCPHAGGVGLCEYVQHISIFDFICVSASLNNRVVEYADHLHEHFVHPVSTRNGHYVVPMDPGYSAQMKTESLNGYEYPNGAEWQKLFEEGKFTSPQ